MIKIVIFVYKLIEKKNYIYIESNLIPFSSQVQLSIHKLEARLILHGSMFTKKYVQMVGKLLFVCIVKKVAKGGVI